MDLEKLLKFASEQLSEYLWAFWETLCAPKMLFQNTISTSQESSARFAIDRTSGSERLNPAVIGFFTINVVIGTSLAGLTPGKRSAPELLVIFFVCFATSILYGAVLHLLCLLLGGRGSSQSTLSACLQTTSTIFVVSCLAGLLVGLILAEPHVRRHLLRNRFVMNTIFFFPISFFIQFLMQSIYMPAAMASVHRFNRRKAWMLRGMMTIFAIVGTAICILMYVSLGIMTPMQG